MNEKRPDGLGLTIARSVRNQPLARIQIMLVTRPADESVRVAWLHAGVDDYLSRPYSSSELIARVQARLHFVRCTGSHHLQTRTSYLAWNFVPKLLQVIVRGVPIQLTQREYAILAALHFADGQVVSRSDLFRDVFGYKSVVDSRAVDVHVARLRHLLGDNGKTCYPIRTIRNCGYLLDRSQS